MSVKRLTYRDAKGEAWYSDKGTEADRLHFIADIEDIMGDECNLGRLIELVTAYKEGRYIIMRYAEQKGVARLLELSEADRDGRCVVLKARCDSCSNCVDQKGYHWCKFWGALCPDDSEFYCKAAESAMKARDGE